MRCLCILWLGWSYFNQLEIFDYGKAGQATFGYGFLTQHDAQTPQNLVRFRIQKHRLGLLRDGPSPPGFTRVWILDNKLHWYCGVPSTLVFIYHSRDLCLRKAMTTGLDWTSEVLKWTKLTGIRQPNFQTQDLIARRQESLFHRQRITKLRVWVFRNRIVLLQIDMWHVEQMHLVEEQCTCGLKFYARFAN